MSLPETICITIGGASANKPCIFPFKFNGAVYSECTWDQAHLTEHKAWCSTLVDETGHHVGGQGKWGNCGPGCPIPPDNRNDNKTKPGRVDIWSPYKAAVAKLTFVTCSLQSSLQM